MNHRFGQGTAFRVGIEEELLLVDPVGRGLAPEAERVLARLELPDGAAAHEAYAAEIELRSPPTLEAEEAAAALRRARAAARAATGVELMGSGLHPAADWGSAPLVPKDRYRRVEEEMRGLIRRTPECALHVHVGMPDPEAAIRACDGLRERLPLLAGLAANSPFWFGRDSGLASARAALTRAYPGRGTPPALGSFAAYEERLERVAAGGGPNDYTLLWWDVRPHPRFGTVEVREMDTQSRLDDAAALAALIQALARREAERDHPDPTPADVLGWSAFRAARDGLDARILHDGRLTPLREAAEELLRELGANEGVERILREGNGADRRRAAHERGGMPAVLEELVAETAS